MSRTAFPKWRDGQRYCPGCGKYLDPDVFPKRQRDGTRRRDGLATYCIACQRARDHAYHANRRSGQAHFRPPTARDTVWLHGSIPMADRDLAERRGHLGHEVFYLGGKTPHAGVIAGIRQDARYGLLVWVDFTDSPLRVNYTDVLGVTLIRAMYLAVRQNGHSVPEPTVRPPWTPRPVSMPLWIA